jgi:hypothetical protein
VKREILSVSAFAIDGLPPIFKLTMIGARDSMRLYGSITLPSCRMAGEFQLVDLPVSGSESSPSLEIEYFATAYHKSLDTFHSYMESLRKHLNLLYGR